MKKKTDTIHLMFVVFLLSVFLTSPVSALDTKYNRNGEVYFLIGEQNESGKPNPFKGIYRMNNPETNIPYPTGGVRYIKDFGNTIGFTVDLERYIYPFTENIPTSPTQEKYIYRQVVDTATSDHVDYGLHAYFHDDYRNFSAGTDIYRSNVGRSSNGKIRNVPLSRFKSLGPGEYVGPESNLPEGYVYIEGTGNGKVVKQPNKPWYKILNNRWYSCWKQGNTTGAFGGKFYWTVGDQEWSKIHKFMVNKWGPGPGFSELVQDKYSEIASGKTQVGQTWEISLTRYCRAGCLDSCGNANGSGSGSAPTASASVAFQPAPTGSTTGNRAYFYTRVSGSNNYSLKYNGTKYPEASIIGYPKDLTTYWIGVSLKGVNDDFVYALGTNVIKDWYHAYTNSYQHNMNISSTAVSNQWEQKGGIVFAYDRANDIIYKFVRNDKEGLGTVDYEAISCSDLAATIGSANSSLDDIKADGFGSLYFALSYPAKSVADGYDPTKHFKPKDAEHMCLIDITMEGNYICDILFRQKYSKVIYKRDYLSGVISEVGRRDYAYKVYSIVIAVPKTLYDELNKLSWPNDQWYKMIRKAYDEATPVQKLNSYFLGGYSPISSSLESKYFGLGRDQCGHSPWPMYETFNEENPGQTQLAVINVPTPPEVRHIGPYKVSYLDICGPYESLPLPPYPNNERTTNQQPPTVSSSNLQPSKIYFYMVENYPLEDGAQDPTLNPDCDKDSRLGGFVSSISDPKTGENGGAVHYEWKLWLVEDPFKNKCCELYDEETNGSYSFPFWYYAGSKFILICRVKYNWYNYDLLTFGDTVDKKESVLRTNVYAWPSEAGGSFDMATATVRLNEIMNTSNFSFMKPSNNPKDVEGNDIDYSSTILGNDTYYKYWAIEPIVVNGEVGTFPEDLTLTASLERCDHIYKTNGTAAPDPVSYLFKTGAASHWSLPESSTNSFTIETGKTFYWRMAIASQAKLFCDISNSTKIDYSRINDEDFNMVAYLLSTQYINGKENKNYANSNPNLQFYPLEPGSCWWRQKKDKDGNLMPPEVKVQALLKYKLPDGSIRQIPLHDQNGTGAPITVPLQTGETTLWQKNKPLYATMSSELDVPPTDPFVGTLSVELSRQYYYKMWILNNDGVRMKDIKVGPLTLALTAEASIRVLDTDKPTIVYNETAPINLFGLTGRALATSYAGETKTNPANVTFSISDNNAWEAAGETGLSTLYKHVENYMYNFGVEECEKYTKGSSVLEGYFNTAKGVLGNSWKGIRKDIENAMNAGNKSSHLNMRPLFSKFARDTRFVFDTSVRNLDGSISYGRGDTFKYNSGTKQYLKDDDLFDGDNSSYAYNPGIKPNSNLAMGTPITVDDGGNKFHAVMKYSMALGNIKIRNGANKVPEGYANNTPGYSPYQFYVRSTDCSGNYTFVNKGDNKINGYMPLNMALHVRDDIPPIPYGSVKEFKNGNEYIFPQEKGDIASSTSSPLAFSVANTSTYPEYFGMNLNDNFLRQRLWCADNKVTGYFKGDSSYSYKALLSFCESAVSPNDLSIANGNTVKNKSNFITQLKYCIAPYYVEDNVECVFKAYSSDNAGTSVATLSFKYYTTDNPGSGDDLIGQARSKFESAGIVADGKIASSSVDASAMFRGPRDKFPLAIPIMITAEDDAKDWDEYMGYNSNPSDPTKVSSIWGTLKKGGSKPNQRTFLSTLAVFNSGLDVRVLEKTLKNN